MRILCGIVRIESGCFSLLYWSAEKYREAVAGGIVYGAVHPAAAHQGRVGRIDDGVRLLKDDAVMNDLNRFPRSVCVLANSCGSTRTLSTEVWQI